MTNTKKTIKSLAKVSFLTKAMSDGIPARAALVGLIAGSVNAAIVVAVTLAQHGGLNAMPLAPLVQAFSLPILFGVLSQSIAYRRAAGAMARA